MRDDGTNGATVSNIMHVPKESMERTLDERRNNHDELWRFHTRREKYDHFC